MKFLRARGARYAVVIAVALAFTGCAQQSIETSVSIAGSASPTPSPQLVRDADVAAIYELARNRDAADLEARAGSEQRAHQPVDPAVALALYTIDRAKYATALTNDYPVTRDGVTNDYGVRFARADIPGTDMTYPVRELRDRAIAGDAVAARDLFAGVALSEGTPLAGPYLDAARALVKSNAVLALNGLAAAPSAAQLAVISLPAWCADQPKALYSAASPTPHESDLIAEMHSDLGNACARPARPTRRRAHRRPAKRIPASGHPHHAAGV